MIDFHNHILLPSDPDGDGLVLAINQQGIERSILHACPRAVELPKLARRGGGVRGVAE